ncbi:hypothetical protein [Albibacillus kandeliae]|uniref:hypothetical protein n=1 Tax=Albibacillus kandeliae TaxID=2174228 RepID=UPI000D69F575|nr:hypothetical protein [Albibacillus kandeliae]
MLDIVIWVGAALSLAGLAGVIWCILKVMKARRAGLTDEQLRAVLARVLPINLGALFVSVLGLMMVVAGAILS